jgi:hypothetical protein
MMKLRVADKNKYKFNRAFADSAHQGSKKVQSAIIYSNVKREMPWYNKAPFIGEISRNGFGWD